MSVLIKSLHHVSHWLHVNQFKRLAFIKNLMKTLVCHQRSILQHKEPLYLHSVPYQRSVLCASRAHKWTNEPVCASSPVSAHIHMPAWLNHCMSLVHQWGRVDKSRIIFRSGCVALSHGMLTLINLHRLRGSVYEFCINKLVVWGSIYVGRLLWDGSQAGGPRRPPVSAKQRQLTSWMPLMWQSHLYGAPAADGSCRCPAKIKDSAANAINKQWVGGEEKQTEEFKRVLLWLDTDRRRACPCWDSDYPLI